MLLLDVEDGHVPRDISECATGDSDDGEVLDDEEEAGMVGATSTPLESVSTSVAAAAEAAAALSFFISTSSSESRDSS